MPIDFERLTSPDYIADLTERPLDEVRAMRSECQAVENALSLVRRVVHGRLDIVGGEQARRREGRPAEAISDLIDALPALLADRAGGGGLPQRPPQEIDPTEAADQLISELDETVVTGQLGSLADRTDEELEHDVTALGSFEATISARRRRMHDVIDALQAEITRRYRTGEATVDSLLS
ncbi:MAG: hypothetical protein OEU32_05425 [Acidimicrobiia bacterium]|nr:hypothetical protein [Acidimicrobiia bacterium]